MERLEPRALFSASVAAGSDLAAQFVNRPLHLPATQTAPLSTGTFKLRFSNTGSAPEVERLSAKFYISTSSTLASTALPAGTARGWHLSLPPGASKVLSGTVVVPPGVDPGSYFLLAAVKESTGQTILTDQPLTLTHVKRRQPSNDQSSDAGGINDVDGGCDTSDSCPTPTDNAPATAPTTTSATQPANDDSQPPVPAPTDDGSDDSNAPTEAPDTPDSGDIGDVGDAYC